MMNFETTQQAPSLIRSPVLWALMLASLALSTTLAYLLNIRFDEAFTLNTTSQGVVYAFQQAINFEQQAPLYFVVMSVWRTIDPSIFFARFFSVLCFPIFIWVAAEVAKRYLKDVNPLFVAAVAAVHQQAIWNSLDIRLYALMALLSGLLFLLFYDGYLAEKPSKRSRILYIVVAVLSLYTQYYLGFQLVAGAFVLVALRRWRPLIRYVADMAIAGVFFIPLLLIVYGQLTDVTGQKDAALPIFELVKGIYQRIVSLFVAVEWIQFEFLKRWFVRVVVVAVGALFVLKLVRRRKNEDIALGVFCVVLTAFFLVTYYLVGDQAIQPRHMLSLLLPLAIIPFAALVLLKRPGAIIAWLVLVIALNAAFLINAYSPLAKPGDFDRAARYVMANEQANQPVLVFHADAVLPLSYYYKGQNKLVAIPQENDFDVWNPRNNVLRDEAQILSLINAQPNEPERFWLIHDGWCAHGTLSFNCHVLDDVIDKFFVVESTQNFLEPVTVRLLRRK